MNPAQHRLRVPEHPLGWLTVIGLVLTVVPLLGWAVHSMTLLTQACGVEDWWWACIPAVATNGVMIAATRISMNDDLDAGTRRYAMVLAVIGGVGDVLATGAQHGLAAASGDALAIDPHPLVGFAIGGLPSAMGLSLIHLVFRVTAHNRRVTVAAEAARLEAERVQHAAAVAATERDTNLKIAEVQAQLANAEARKETARTEAARLETEQTKAEAARVSAEARLARSATAPAARPKTGSGRGPAPARRTGPATAQAGPASTGPDVSDLLEAGWAVAEQLAEQQQPLNKRTLGEGLRDAGRSCATNRLNELLRVLRSDTNGPAQVRDGRGPDRALRAVAR